MPAHHEPIGWKSERILIVGKTYPSPSAKHIETVCTGGISEDGTWRRLYPVNFRYLDEEQKYRTWDWIRADTQKYKGDARACSVAVREESITVEGHEDTWAGKWRMLRPLVVAHHEELDAAHERDPKGVTMAAIEIRLEKFDWEETGREWSPSVLAKINQELLFVKRKPLAKVPFQFHIKFRCANNAACPTHTKTLLWWDFQQAFLGWREKYGEVETLRLMREKVESELDPKTHLPVTILGTLKEHPDNWSIGGLFTPPRREIEQPLLF